MNKKYFLLAFGLFANYTFAQNSSNTLLNVDFWKNNPDVTTIKAEIAKGNNPSEANRMAFDPVVLAIMNGASLDAIKYLLAQKGNDLNKPTHDGRSYIFWAGMKGNLPLVQFLIAQKADINMEDSHGATPLSFSANAENSLEIIKALVNAGADLKHTYQNGANLLLMCVSNDKDLKLTEYLESKGLSLQSKDENGATAFDYAARAGNVDILKKLFAKGIKPTNSALIFASEGTRRFSAPLEAYEYIISLGISPTATDSEGKNVLHNLLRKSDQQNIIEYFLSKGVDINQADKEGNTAFMNAAASNRDMQLLTSLLPKVKNINSKNEDGVSALALAVKGNSAEVVSLLLSHGADLQTKDNKGNTLGYYLLESAGRSGRGGMMAPPAGNRPPEGGPQRPPMGRGEGPAADRKDDFAEKLTLLQSKGLNFAVPQEDGNSLLYLAVAKNNLELLKKIQGLGIDVNAKNTEGMTALHKAALLAKDDTILKFLLSIGADKSIKDEMDETAYDLAKDNKYLSENKISIDFLK